MFVVSGRLARALSGIAATAAVAAGLFLAPTATAAEPDGPHYQEPTVGQCRNYGFSAAMGTTAQTPVVACSARHTAKTVAVVQLPSSMSWSAPLNDIGTAAGEKCEPAYREAVGGTDLKRRMSRYLPSVYMPTQAQRDHGARWVRCDVVALGRSALVPLPNTTPMLPADKVPYKVTKCLVGADRYYTACAFTHNYRVTGGFTVSGTTYPGNTALQRAAQRRCPSMVTSRRYISEVPDRESWRAGHHVVLCYTQTNH